MSIQKKKQNIARLRIILLTFLLLLGFYFRFANLEQKVFWVDEISTAIRASGYTISEATNELKQQGIIEFQNLLAYQNISPNKTFSDSWQALTKSPEHAPLYFVLTRLWMQLWGSSIFAMRSLSAVLSLLVFPALYWLCRELFNKSSVGYIAIILMSVSPFFVAYAQEARPYTLWTITVLLMSASLLRAVRFNNKQSWLLYGISLVLGFYTSLFSIYVALFQGIYIAVAPIENKLKIIKKFLLSSSIALLIFSPWIFVIANHVDLLQENTSWMRGNFNLAEIIAVFIGTVLLIFGDLPISPDSNPVQIAIVLVLIVILALIATKSRLNKKPLVFALLLAVSSSVFLFLKQANLDLVSVVGALVALAILGLSGYSLYYLITNTPKNRWLFILCLIISLPLPLLIVDIINQGQGSTAPRYLIPLQLGIQIAVAYTINGKLKQAKNNFWQFILAGFLILGIFSCIRNLNLSPFYQKGRNINNPAIATIIDRANSPLVVVESVNAMDMLSLAYSLSPQTKYKIIDSDENITNYLNNFQNIFILKLSQDYQNKLQQNYKISIQQVYKSHLFSADEIPLDLWQIQLNS